MINGRHARLLKQDLPSCAGRHCSGQGMAGLALLVTIALLAGDAVGQTINYWKDSPVKVTSAAVFGLMGES
jgi:hypothetical protein